MRRGELWTMRDRGFASKARPVVIIQDERFDCFDSVILCLLTTFDSEAIPTRVRVEPTPENGLSRMSYVMTDKVVTVDKALLGEHIGRLSDTDLALVSEQLKRVLGI